MDGRRPIATVERWRCRGYGAVSSEVEDQTLQDRSLMVNSRSISRGAVRVRNVRSELHLSFQLAGFDSCDLFMDDNRIYLLRGGCLYLKHGPR